LRHSVYKSRAYVESKNVAVNIAYTKKNILTFQQCKCALA